MSLFGPLFLAVLAAAPVPAEPGFLSAAQLSAMGMMQDPRDTQALIEQMRSPDLRAANQAWVGLWMMPREWTPVQLLAILQWLPAAPLPLQDRAADRLPALLGMLVGQRQDRGEADFLPGEIPLMQSLYSASSGPLLQNLLGCDRLLRSVPIPPGRFEQWLKRADDVSLPALRLAPDRIDAPSLVSLLEADWEQASPAWRLQSVQLASGAPEYLAWLRRHAAGEGELAHCAQTTLQLHSQDPKERKATAEIIGKSNDPGVMTALLAAVRDPDESVAASALATFWENPRPYTADVMEDMLHLIPDVSLPLKRTIVENLPLITSVIAQQRVFLRLASLSPPDLQIIQSLYDSDDPRILRNLLADYRYFSSVSLSEEQLRRWIAMADDISIKALPLAPRWVEGPLLVAALSERWKSADGAWKLQAVQIPWRDPQYLGWLAGHLEPGEVGEMARLTLITLSGLTRDEMAEVRTQLASPAALHRWAQMLPALGRAAGDLALAELLPDGLLTPDLIPYWNIFGIVVPPEIAEPLLSDRRMAVRSFAEQFFHSAAPAQAKAWCASEYYDVRVLGARMADRTAVEDLLVDDRPEVRLAALVRWATENWPGLDQTLRYGLSDPLLTDNLLLATVGLPQCQTILAAWGASEPQRSKLNSAKSIPHRPLPLPLPAR